MDRCWLCTIQCSRCYIYPDRGNDFEAVGASRSAGSQVLKVKDSAKGKQLGSVGKCKKGLLAMA